MKNKILAYGSAIAGTTLLGLAIVSNAMAQTVPTWSTTDTSNLVTTAATSFEQTFVYTVTVMAPYAIIVSLILGLVWFFVRMARNH